MNVCLPHSKSRYITDGNASKKNFVIVNVISYTGVCVNGEMCEVKALVVIKPPASVCCHTALQLLGNR